MHKRRWRHFLATQARHALSSAYLLDSLLLARGSRRSCAAHLQTALPLTPPCLGPSQIEAVRMRAKRKLLHVRGQVVDSFLSTLLPQLMLLAVGSLLAQGLRRDGSFAVAIYTLLAGFSQKDYLIRFAIWLLIFSLCADFFWIIVQGPLAFVDEPPYVVLTDSTESANVAGDKIVEAINGTLARSVTMEETLKVMQGTISFFQSARLPELLFLLPLFTLKGITLWGLMAKEHALKERDALHKALPSDSSSRSSGTAKSPPGIDILPGLPGGMLTEELLGRVLLQLGCSLREEGSLTLGVVAIGASHRGYGHRATAARRLVRCWPARHRRAARVAALFLARHDGHHYPRPHRRFRLAPYRHHRFGHRHRPFGVRLAVLHLAPLGRA